MDSVEPLPLTDYVQQHIDNPMRLVWRYVLAFLGGFLAMGAHLYITSNAQDWLSPGRLGLAIAGGLIFGIITGAMVIVASEYPQRLKKTRPMNMRAALAIIGGIALGTLAWFAFSYLVLFNEAPDWTVLLAGGLGLSAGFILSGLMTMPRLASIAITAVSIYIPIFITFQNYAATLYNKPPAMALLYYAPNREWMLLAVGIPFALCIAILGHLPVPGYPSTKK